MRTRKSIWYGVLGINLGLLAGCDGSGVVLDRDETGGTRNSGGADHSSGGSDDRGAGAAGGSDPGTGGGPGQGGDRGGAGGYGAGGYGTAAVPGYGGAVDPGYGGAGGLGTAASPGYGGAGGFGTAASPGYGGAGGLGTAASPGYGGAGGLGTAASPGYGGAGATPGSVPIDPEDCTMMVAPPIEVPAGADMNACFGFTIEANGAIQIAAVYPELVNTQTIHHMTLYRAPAGALPVGQCPADETKGAPIYAFSPGAKALELPSDIGLGLGTGQFIVEVHYVNTSEVPLVQSAGFCTLLTPRRPYEAEITRLGKRPVTVPNGGGASTSICVPPITSGGRILSTTLDLGRRGERARAFIQRRGGGFEALIDQPSSDTISVTLPTIAHLDAGDSIYTSCLHSNPTGTTVSDYSAVHCNFWMLTYPLGQFTDAGADSECGH